MFINILLVLAVLTLIIMGIQSRKYKVELSELDKKEYLTQRFMQIGLLLYDRAPFYKNQKKIHYELLQLYGRQEYKKRVRLYRADQMTLVVCVLFAVIVLSLVIIIKNCSSYQVNEIERGAYGEGDKRYTYYYQIDIGETVKEGEIQLVVPQMKPTKEEAQEFLKQVATKVLPDKILGENTSLDAVYESLNLPYSYLDVIEIIWESENEKLLLSNGEIRYNNLLQDEQKVILRAVLKYENERYTQNYEITLRNKGRNIDENMMLLKKELKNLLSEQALKGNDSKQIVLPEYLSRFDASIKWFKYKKPLEVSTILLLGSIIAISIYFLKEKELKEKVKTREDAVRIAFPSWVNQFELLMNAGMTFRLAFEKIGKDYEQLSINCGEKNILYEEMLITIEDITKGVSETRAYEDFASRCKIPEVLRFVSAVIQNMKKGGNLLLIVIAQQAKEALLIRQEVAKKKGEKASTRLVLPMGIMLIAILIIVMTPAIITLNI